MKKILVLTDLSDNAAHAAKTAMNLAAKLNCEVLLYHAMTSIPIVPNYAGGAFVTETVSIFAEESNEKLKLLADELQAGSTMGVQITIKNGEGGLGENVKELIRDNDIELIVMGAPAGGVWDHLLTGSETRAVIRNTDRPVLFIPAERDTKSLLRLVLATDYNETDLCALRYLSKWVADYHCLLDIVHIQVGDDAALWRPEQKQVFEIYLTGLNYAGICCHDLRGNDPLSRLNRFCEDKKVDVLAMVNYHNDFFSKLLGTSQTFKALHHLQLPILVFPANFCDETICPM
ncbi:universal stress protein [Mucilaginibacter boryungensis]|uniref:Universal stress protein n=1 Tax=Mucilaginibacter boryungensis TaxID=768480 RepID=A0ABR9XES5_9SPHI|nr:universal stress protein [Mucilaginibacter boryungensis]MBE9665700.1 universal stress protein [Mucilaginibacter boryungensis]